MSQRPRQLAGASRTGSQHGTRRRKTATNAQRSRTRRGSPTSRGCPCGGSCGDPRASAAASAVRGQGRVAPPSPPPRRRRRLPSPRLAKAPSARLWTLEGARGRCLAGRAPPAPRRSPGEERGRPPPTGSAFPRGRSSLSSASERAAGNGRATGTRLLSLRGTGAAGHGGAAPRAGGGGGAGEPARAVPENAAAAPPAGAQAGTVASGARGPAARAARRPQEDPPGGAPAGPRAMMAGGGGGGPVASGRACREPRGAE